MTLYEDRRDQEIKLLEGRRKYISGGQRKKLWLMIATALCAGFVAFSAGITYATHHHGVTNTVISGSGKIATNGEQDDLALSTEDKSEGSSSTPTHPAFLNMVPNVEEDNDDDDSGPELRVHGPPFANMVPHMDNIKVKMDDGFKLGQKSSKEAESSDQATQPASYTEEEEELMPTDETVTEASDSNESEGDQKEQDSLKNGNKENDSSNAPKEQNEQGDKQQDEEIGEQEQIVTEPDNSETENYSENDTEEQQSPDNDGTVSEQPNEPQGGNEGRENDDGAQVTNQQSGAQKQNVEVEEVDILQEKNTLAAEGDEQGKEVLIEGKDEEKTEDESVEDEEGEQLGQEDFIGSGEDEVEEPPGGEQGDDGSDDDVKVDDETNTENTIEVTESQMEGSGEDIKSDKQEEDGIQQKDKNEGLEDEEAQETEAPIEDNADEGGDEESGDEESGEIDNQDHSGDIELGNGETIEHGIDVGEEIKTEIEELLDAQGDPNASATAEEIKEQLLGAGVSGGPDTPPPDDNAGGKGDAERRVEEAVENADDEELTTLLQQFKQDPEIITLLKGIIADTDSKDEKLEKEYEEVLAENKRLQSLPKRYELRNKRKIGKVFKKGIVAWSKLEDSPKYAEPFGMSIHLDNIVFVTAVSENHFFESQDAIAGIQTVFPNARILYYDVGLYPYQVKQIKEWCNVVYRKFDFEKYPDHVKNLQLYAFKPLIIKEVLNERPNIIWIDASYRPGNGDITVVYEFAKKHGGIVLANDAKQNITTSTNPLMYDYLPTVKYKIRTMTMGSAGVIFIRNSPRIYWGIMYWWFLCALQDDCIAPADSLRKCAPGDPNEMPGDYHHCHRFDQSALNILLANYYQFDRTQYFPKYSDRRQLADHLSRNITRKYNLQRCYK